MVVTNVCWIMVALFSKPTQEAVLVSFVAKIRPMGQGWSPIIEKAIQTGALTSQQMGTGKLANQILAMIVGCFMIYGLLFGLGYLIYGQIATALICFGVFLISAFVIWKLWSTLKN